MVLPMSRRTPQNLCFRRVYIGDNELQMILPVQPVVQRTVRTKQFRMTSLVAL